MASATNSAKPSDNVRFDALRGECSNASERPGDTGSQPLDAASADPTQMAKQRLLYVVGARPNFVKMAPVVAELKRRRPDADHVVVHTGQH